MRRQLKEAVQCKVQNQKGKVGPVEDVADFTEEVSKQRRLKVATSLFLPRSIALKLNAKKLAANKLSANKVATNKLPTNKLPTNKLPTSKEATSTVASNKVATITVASPKVTTNKVATTNKTASIESRVTIKAAGTFKVTETYKALDTFKVAEAYKTAANKVSTSKASMSKASTSRAATDRSSTHKPATYKAASSKVSLSKTEEYKSSIPTIKIAPKKTSSMSNNYSSRAFDSGRNMPSNSPSSTSAPTYKDAQTSCPDPSPSVEMSSRSSPKPLAAESTAPEPSAPESSVPEPSAPEQSAPEPSFKPQELTPKRKATPKRTPRPRAPRKKEDIEEASSSLLNDLLMRQITTAAVVNQIPKPPGTSNPIFGNGVIPHNNNNNVIEISSDEDDTKLFPGFPLPKTMPQYAGRPTQRAPQMGTTPKNPPAPNVYMGHCRGESSPHYPSNCPRTSPSHTPTFGRSANYPPPMLSGFYQSPANFAPGFYTDTFSNNFRLPAINIPNPMSQDVRYRPYHAIQRQFQEVDLQPPANACSSGLSAADISKWLSSRYGENFEPDNRQRHQNQQQQEFYSQQYQQQQMALVPISGTFYGQLHEPQAPPLSLMMSNNGPGNNFWMPEESGMNFGMPRMRDGGNNWASTQALFRKFLESNADQVSRIMNETSRQTSPTMHADSTTGGGAMNSNSTGPNRTYIPPGSVYNQQRFQSSNQNYFNGERKLLANGVVNASAISPAMGQLTLYEDHPDGFYRSMSRMPEYDPRDNR